MLAGLELRVAAIKNAHILDHATVSYLAIRRFNETEFIYSRKTGKTRDQADVWTFRRLNRADAAIVSRVNVAHFESRAFARKSARSQRRQSAFVRNFRKRVGLVHEL